MIRVPTLTPSIINNRIVSSRDLKHEEVFKICTYTMHSQTRRSFIAILVYAWVLIIHTAYTIHIVPPFPMAMPISDLVFISMLLQMLLYGMYTCLFLEASYLLIFRRKKSKVIIIMIVLNTIMWSVATTNIAMTMNKDAVRFLRQNGIENITVFDDYATPEIYLQLGLAVIWRAWLLWNQKRWILVVSSFLLLGTGVTVANMTYALSASPITPDNLFDDPKLSTWGIATMMLTTMTNLFATSLIAYRTWSHHRLLRSLTGKSGIVQLCKQNGILALLIESGVFYCCTWHFNDMTQQQLATIIIFATTNNGINLMLDVLFQLTAIYPTLIIILVSMRSTLDVAIQTFEQTCGRLSIMSPRPLPMHTSVTSPSSIEVETVACISSDNIESFPVNGEDKKLVESFTNPSLFAIQRHMHPGQENSAFDICVHAFNCVRLRLHARYPDKRLTHLKNKPRMRPNIERKR
ncbi:hypothetical protein EDD85DRAFT_791084 [Armillaria nabsnona]|nr:hypothetical protein EDD85DRAFT_791084 [Armillaria nabsnona]